MNRTSWSLTPSLRTSKLIVKYVCPIAIIANAFSTVECESCRRPGIEAISFTPPVRLYWVKDQDIPVDSMPPDILHESHFHLRSKALQQRQNTPSGSTCYDMEVFYQFWSHFLIRNFNTRMYEEFQRLALDDEVHNGMDVGLLSLIKLYTQCLLSPQTMARYLVVRDYVTLVEFEDDGYCPAFTHLQSDLESRCLHSSSRRRSQRLLTSDVLTLLEF